MRILALDIGDVHIGLAVSDELGISVNGLPSIRRRSDEQALDDLRLAIEGARAEKLVVGVPYNLDGTTSRQTEKTLAFKDKLTNLGLPVDEMDERWTTLSAERVLLEADLSRRKRKKLVDKVSAVLILRSYLNLQESKR